jgi:membrane fusion protein, multidrug efflux system
MKEETVNETSHKKRVLIGGAWIAVALLMISLAYYFLYARVHESTDDAMIDAHIISINSKIAGQVARVVVDDNQEVQQGALLVEVDPQDFQVKLDQARAEWVAAQAEAKRAATDAVRYEQLLKRDQISRQVYDKSVADTDVAKAKALVAEKKAAAAELDLTYTKIFAPESGRVARRGVEVRSFVQIGQPLMAVVPKQVWVTANFKETQLVEIRPGQPVKIHVDAYPDHTFRGHVDSIQAGSGARFSLFPPENATGNFVKVVQRIPVKIVFDEPTDQFLLAPGMSVVPVIKTN